MRFTVSPEWEGKLLRDFLAGEVCLSHRLLSRLKQKADGITLNGAAVTVRAVLRGGDVVCLAVEDEPLTNLLPPSTPADVIYEDAALLVCNKSGDMPTHPSHGHYDDTLANAVAAYDAARDLTPRPFRPVNRLDRQTSGTVLVARDAMAAAKLSDAMSRREIHKSYLAVLEGVPAEPDGHIHAPIRRAAPSIILRQVCAEQAEGAQEAHTEYRVLATWDDASAPQSRRSLVLAIPHTGRTHQLRLHFAHLGTPIAGDGLYGSFANAPRAPRQLLHAVALRFPHPTTGEHVTICAPLPEDILTCLPPALRDPLCEQQIAATLQKLIQGERL